MEIFDFPGDLRRSIASRKSYDREDEGRLEVLGEAGRVAEGLVNACLFVPPKEKLNYAYVGLLHVISDEY